MSSERGERGSSKVGAIISSMPTKPTEPEQLPCPRCDSTNTKFCYYNNYNLSQPRHFCKSCRRYWTRGGTLRNVPIGGGTRRSSSSSNKRPRTDSATSAPSSAQEVLNSLPVQEMGHGLGSLGGYIGGQGGFEMNLNEALPENNGSFSSLLNGDMHGGGLFWGGQNRFVGVGSGFYGMGFGVNVLDFPMEPVRDGGGAAVVSGGGGGGGNTWQMSGVEAGINDGGNNNDNFSWPDLAISTPAGKSLK
ncbi:hypothetical protein Leryth_014553 [Lithospermum erythrorhizon]|uniref:Dof zinc finger protein n=1 Tax=Lithospermum erythrorhizon TaxID=34254 RepID=A0AAV3R5P0_LITER|nr:hypothetical protein Leryth_014553 [Lithospermum erythrorhizon]